MDCPKAINSVKRADIIAALQTDIMRLQGFKSASSTGFDVGLGPLNNAFPDATFPSGAIHEFLTARKEDAAATSGFIAGLLTSIKGGNSTVLWIGTAQTVFPPALKSFGLQPDYFVFVDLQKERDILWTMEEALKCSALTAVVGEMSEISFTASRRLQLAVEQSQVTGFVLRSKCEKLNTTACVSRWKISPLSSELFNDLPGIGFPKWRVELLRIRNGKPGVWEVQWRDGQFHQADNLRYIPKEEQRKAG